MKKENNGLLSCLQVEELAEGGVVAIAAVLLLLLHTSVPAGPLPGVALADLIQTLQRLEYYQVRLLLNSNQLR